ncbi:Cof-type HAD-IIB family hydrolase [Atopobacter phocae]|uniref:Cof-type HAD-IIB family hydrolase n=1 Tax=Atopobacter phocae TaxID=136492 RepID=UPI00046FC95E|nr:Cof-type HAD-IIB family hydrolase [Atopobacter phocae]
MTIQLVASDMDGTLLIDHSTIPIEVANKIKALQNDGITFIAATGRTIEQARHPFEMHGIKTPLIALNGAEVYDENNQLLLRHSIDSSLVETLIRKAEERGFIVEIMTTKGIYMRNRQERIESFISFFKTAHPELTEEEADHTVIQLEGEWQLNYEPDLERLIQEADTEVLKLSIFTIEDIDGLGQLQSDFVDTYPEISVTSSGHGNIELNAVEAQKGKALAFFAERHQFDLERTLSIGDNYNDLSMLAIAGFSYAVDNAVPKAKEVAKYTTVSNQQFGLIHALEHAESILQSN